MTPKVVTSMSARRSVSDQAYKGRGDNSVSISIGNADISAPGIGSAGKLIRAADIPLYYEATKKGSNRIEVGS